MGTGVVLDARYMAHDTGAGHPERPERIGVLLLSSVGERPDVTHVPARLATGDDVTLVHGEGHFETGGRHRAARPTMPSTPTRPSLSQSFETACLAAGGRPGVCSTRSWRAACATASRWCGRPGHHAERDRAMGFCLFNNIAIGAAHTARARHRARARHGDGLGRASRQRHATQLRSRSRRPVRVHPSLAVLSRHRRAR
jgi:acetoin utilization deacetylase AcuC-like enzyme